MCKKLVLGLGLDLGFVITAMADLRDGGPEQRVTHHGLDPVLGTLGAVQFR